DWTKAKYKFREQQYDRLNWFILSFFESMPYYYRNARAGGMADFDMAPAAMAEAVYVDGITVEEAKVKRKSANLMEQEPQELTVAGYEGEKMEQQQTQTTMDVVPRTNLQETAFFFPDLQTDEEGNIIFSFTVPEALTRWKLMGFA